jgi:hypothetical protein
VATDPEYGDLSEEEITRYMVEHGVPVGNGELLPTIDIAAFEAEDAKTQQFGDMNGLDAPRDVSWRLQAEELIKGAVTTVASVRLYDVTWNIADLQVVLESAEPSAVVGIDEIVAVNRAIQNALEPFEVGPSLFIKSRMITMSELVE